MSLVTKLTQINCLRGGTALVIGGGDLRLARILKEKGYEIEVVDILKNSDTELNIKYHQIPIEEFKTTKKYDLVIANNVLPFTQKPLQELSKIISLLQEDGTIYFTLFGEKDEWNGSKEHIQFLSQESILKSIDENKLSILFRTEEFGLGRTKTNTFKTWHIFRFIAQKGDR